MVQAPQENCWVFDGVREAVISESQRVGEGASGRTPVAEEPGSAHTWKYCAVTSSLTVVVDGKREADTPGSRSTFVSDCLGRR